MIPLIIITLSLILDGILSNIFPYTVNNLSLFTPLLTLISIYLIYPFYKKKENKYILTIFLTGIIYDLLYTNLIFYNAIIFTIIGIISKYIYKHYEINYLNIIIQIILIVTIYELLNALIIILFNLVPMSVSRLFYKITHSLLLNIIYSELLLLIINILPSKYKKVNIN
mgnify:FL=1